MLNYIDIPKFAHFLDMNMKSIDLFNSFEYTNMKFNLSDRLSISQE